MFRIIWVCGLSREGVEESSYGPCWRCGELDIMHVLVRAWRELHGSTSEMDSIAKAVVFYAGGQGKSVMTFLYVNKKSVCLYAETKQFMKNLRVALFRL